jgi:hypothetical protein
MSSDYPNGDVTTGPPGAAAPSRTRRASLDLPSRLRVRASALAKLVQRFEGANLRQPATVHFFGHMRLRFGPTALTVEDS